VQAAGRRQGKPLITHRFPLAQAEEAFAVAENEAQCGAIKVVLLPEGGEA
jgi:threonine dehydrogenase-like Zn-dependent dehydrogenase